MDTKIKIVWTKNAVADFNKIIDYLIENWSENVATNFELVVQNKLEILIKYPSMGMASQRIENVRSFFLTKHNRLYYRFKNNFIELLRILDTRQNPIKNPY